MVYMGRVSIRFTLYVDNSQDNCNQTVARMGFRVRNMKKSSEFEIVLHHVVEQYLGAVSHVMSATTKFLAFVHSVHQEALCY